MANPDRKGGGGLSLQTLVIASAASVTAAMVTSRLFAHGTIYVSAVTPVIVAAVSELLHRPAARASAIRRQRRTLVLEARERQGANVHGDEPSPLRGAPEWAQGGAADEDLGTNGNGDGSYQRPVTIHGRRPWGRIHPKVAIATGLAAFAIAVAVLTLPELLFGGAVANTHRTTFFGGGKTTTTQKQSEPKAQTQTETTPSTVTETVPAQAPAQQSPTDTTTTPTDTGTQTTPTQTQTTPTDTGTSTSPAPSGSAPPVP
jgi:hypothetical protein